MDCVRCNDNIIIGDSIKCSTCGVVSHYFCVGIVEKSFRKMSKVTIEKFKCSSCKLKLEADENSSTKSTRNSVNLPEYKNTLEASQNSSKKDELFQYMEKRFSEVKSDMSNNFKLMREDIMKMLSSKIEENNKLCAKIQEENKQILENLKFIEDSYIDTNKKMESFVKTAENVNKLEKSNNDLMKKISTLENRIDELENKTRETNIEIRGVPENKTENLAELLIKIGKVVNCDITLNDIETVYRITPKDGRSISQSRAIVAKFKSVSKRNYFLTAIKLYNRSKAKEEKLNTQHLNYGCTIKSIFVGEHLTSNQKHLYYLTRKYANENNYQFTWIKHGHLYLRKDDKSRIILVKNESQLCHLQ